MALTDTRLYVAVETLAKSDADLAQVEVSEIVRRHAHPSWQDRPGKAEQHLRSAAQWMRDALHPEAEDPDMLLTVALGRLDKLAAPRPGVAS
jgi:hypothetical protein